MERNILLQADLIAGVANTQADRESWLMLDHWDWKSDPQVLNEIDKRLGPLQVDLHCICLKGVNLAEKILQLEVGPISRRDGCLPPSLRGAILCQPTLGLDTSGPDIALNTEGRYSIDCPSVEDTSVVPITIAALVRLPNTNTSQRHDDTPSQPAPITSLGTGSTVGRMAYFRRYCEAGTFQTKLHGCSWPCSTQNPSLPTTHSFTSGSAGAVNGN